MKKICPQCGAELITSDRASSKITDIDEFGMWVEIELEWYCPECNDYEEIEEVVFHR